MGMIRRSFSVRDKDVNLQLYKLLVKPQGFPVELLLFCSLGLLLLTVITSVVSKSV